MFHRNVPCCIHWSACKPSGWIQISRHLPQVDLVVSSYCSDLAGVISHLCTWKLQALTTGRGRWMSFVDCDCTTRYSAHAVSCSTTCIYSMYVKSGKKIRPAVFDYLHPASTRGACCLWLAQENVSHLAHHLRKWTLLFPWSTTKPNGVKARKAGFPDTSWKTISKIQHV